LTIDSAARTLLRGHKIAAYSRLVNLEAAHHVEVRRLALGGAEEFSTVAAEDVDWSQWCKN
jgi:hypothetical protein